MMLNMGERIRELRRERALTQDEVARRLNISAQAVSKWENAASYPDLELIPPLAELLGISIDALFRDGSDSEADRVCRGADELLSEPARAKESLHALREAAMRFPFHAGILRRLGAALYLAYLLPENVGSVVTDENGTETVVTHGDPALLSEAAAAFERALGSAKNPDERDLIVKKLTETYGAAGKHEKAMSLAEGQSRLAFSREIMVADAEQGEKKDEAAAEALLSLLVQTAAAVLKCIGCIRPDADDAERIVHAERCVSTAKFIESFFPDGRCGRLHFFIAQLYYYPAALYSALGEFDKADESYFPMVRHEKANRAYGESGAYRYTGTLFEKVTDDEPKYVKYEPSGQFFTEEYKAHLKETPASPEGE